MTKNELLAGSQTLDRALSVLLKVGAAPERGLTLAECAAVLGYSKPTTHRILRTLARRGFLQIDEERGVYTLGLTLLRLGMDFLEQLDLRREALPVLQDLADRTGETVHLGVLHNSDVVYIEKVESRHAVRMFSRLGHSMPAASTGVGKAILAFLPPEQLDAALPERIERRTPRTVTSRAGLLAQLAEIRERGYSTDDIENEDGIRCVGAPIFDHHRTVCAAISIAGPEARITRDLFPELGARVREAALSISVRMGYPEDQMTRHADRLQPERI
jgi:IclR family acetate operon transcriptional repressor